MMRVVSLLTMFLLAPADGSYWVVYDGDAPLSCVEFLDGEMVDETCCTDQKQDPQPLITDFYSSTCFVIAGLLGDGGGSLMSYLGCDEGIPTYGEGCYNNGENGGLIPDGTVVADTNATDIGECGCTFQVSGNGCHKIRDFAILPDFANDTRQVFLMMEETCNMTDGGTATTDAPATGETDAPATATPTSDSSATFLPGKSLIMCAGLATSAASMLGTL